MKKQLEFAASWSFFSWFLVQCVVGQDLPFKAVNLGGWLVIEGWMTPSLFDGIPNKDLLVILSLSLPLSLCLFLILIAISGNESLSFSCLWFDRLVSVIV